MNRIAVAALVFAACAIGPTPANSQTAGSQADYPNRPVRVIVAYPAGNGTDVIARIVLARVERILKQQFPIDNRGGAGGNLGAEIAAQARPDGYTLFFSGAQIQAANRHLYHELHFDPLNDFIPIARTNKASSILAVNNDLKVNTTRDLIAYAKAHPGELSYASVGVGSTSHLTMEMFKSQAGIDIRHVPYRSVTQGAGDLANGNIQTAMQIYSALLPYLELGKVRLLGFGDSERFPKLPDLPTIAESSDLKNFSFVTWQGLYAPKGTPQPIIDTLAAAVKQALADPAVRDGFLGIGAVPFYAGPEEFAVFAKSEDERMGQFIKRIGATLD